MSEPTRRDPPTRETTGPLAYRGVLRDLVRRYESGPIDLHDALHNALCALADPRAPTVTDAEFRLLREHTGGWYARSAEICQLLRDLVLERRTSRGSPTLVLSALGDAPGQSAWICAPHHLDVAIESLGEAAREAGVRGSIRHLHAPDPSSRPGARPNSRLALTMDAIRGLDLDLQFDDVASLRAAFRADPPDLLISASFSHVPAAAPSADPAPLSVSFACVAVLDACGRVTTWSGEGPFWIQRRSLLASVAAQAIARARASETCGATIP